MVPSADKRPAGAEPAPNDQTTDMPVVFYDGGCPLCRREIGHYRRLGGSDGVRWVDINISPRTLTGFGLDSDTAMARLHVLDRHGNWQTGAYGFAEIWAHLAGYRWLARVVRRLGLVPLMDACYRPFARWRQRTRCSDKSCALPSFDNRPGTPNRLAPSVVRPPSQRVSPR